MFFRITERKYKDTTYKYLQLVENYSENGKSRQRVLYSFGNIEKLQADGQLCRLAKSLQRAAGVEVSTTLEDFRTGRVLDYGAVRVMQALWDQFNLTDMLRNLLSHRRFQFDAVAAIAMIVFNRLLAPKSERAISDWYDGLWWPQFAAQPLEIHQFYRALEALIAIKEPLEQQLFDRVRDLFNLEVDIVFYDITSTYFEGEGCQGAEYGYSRDKRFDKKQVLLALACDRHGFPIAHEVIPGNRNDVTTVKQMIDSLSQRFDLRRIIFVADSGMVSAKNRQALTEAGYQYLFSIRKDWVPDIETRAPADLEQYEPGPQHVSVYITEDAQEGCRYVCCHSKARAIQEQQIRQARIDAGREALTKIADRVHGGRLKKEQKIVENVTRKLKDTKSTKYFNCDIAEGEFDFSLDEKQVAKEHQLQGRYFLMTNAEDLTPQDAVNGYFTLQEVERAFREIKDFLHVRPIYHQKQQQVHAHIFACVLAYLLERALSHKLRDADTQMSPRTALETVQRVHIVENVIGDKTIWTVSHPSPQAYKVFEAVGITNIPTSLDDYEPVANKQ